MEGTETVDSCGFECICVSLFFMTRVTRRLISVGTMAQCSFWLTTRDGLGIILG